ncbi:MAG TPA: hypothetical protein VN704_09650 [Verrucomicrobiae bacterium]|nr:hypothetical protein [Verrucomicrobiae bacterium]
MTAKSTRVPFTPEESVLSIGTLIGEHPTNTRPVKLLSLHFTTCFVPSKCAPPPFPPSPDSETAKPLKPPSPPAPPFPP